MALKKGEHYRCTNSDCGCEIEVVRDSKQQTNQSPKCGCGQEMKRA